MDRQKFIKSIFKIFFFSESFFNNIVSNFNEYVFDNKYIFKLVPEGTRMRPQICSAWNKDREREIVKERLWTKDCKGKIVKERLWKKRFWKKDCERKIVKKRLWRKDCQRLIVKERCEGEIAEEKFWKRDCKRKVVKERL